MISKKLISTKAKNMVRKTSHIQFISAITTFGLLASQSVYAADEASSGGIPGWVWGLLVLAILTGVMLLPKKWTEQKKTQAPTPTPTIKAETPKVDSAPSVVAPVAPAAVEAPQEVVKETPQPETPIEVADPLAEANQLLDQQRIPQAVGVLNKGLQKNPERSDLMLALLAIYLKQGDHEAFDAQFEQLKVLDDPIALIQAEELHDQLVRPVIVEDSDLIEYDSAKAKAVVSEPEPTPEIAAPDYSTDSLAFTSDKQLVTEPEDLLTPDAESLSFGKTVDITPIETEFSLDDFDLEQTAVEIKETPVEIAAKKPSDDFDFSEFDDFVISAPSENKSISPEVELKETVPTEAEPLVAPVAELVDLAPTQETSPASDLVDLEFDLDDSFSIDEDKVETSAKKSDWSTDLADETFASPTEPAIKDPFAAEIAPEPVVIAPVVPAKIVEPVAKDLASTLEEEFPFLQTADTFQTRLDLARNYIALGEISSAKELLAEVAEQGTGTPQSEARELIAKLAS